MKLSEKIAELRKKRGWSQEELAFRLGVSRQSVSKWESGSALPEVDKIVQLADMFDVSCDYLMKNDLTSVDIAPKDTVVVAYDTANDDNQTSYSSDEYAFDAGHPVDTEEAFIQIRKDSILNAIGVMLCVLCPILLIYFGVHADAGGLSEKLAVGLGLGALFVFVAAGVFLVIIANKCRVSVRLDEETRKQVRRRIAETRPFFITITAIATVLCIVAVVPLVVAAITGSSETIVADMVCVMLAIVAVAVALFVFIGTSTDAYKRIARGEVLVKEKNKKKIVERLSGLYWSLVLAVYFIWSFLGDSWGISWVVWPIAGVLSAVVNAILSLFGLGDDN